MARPTDRRLTMADLAILTAGAALALGILRMSWDTSASTFEASSARSPGYRAGLGIISLSLGLASALVAARLVPPRPRWRAVFRRPGTAACLAILGHMLMVVVAYSWQEVLKPTSGPGRFPINFNLYLQGNKFAGAWVAVAWATLALARAWRPEPGWLDRSGRILGIVAIGHWLWSAVSW